MKIPKIEECDNFYNESLLISYCHSYSDELFEAIFIDINNNEYYIREFVMILFCNVKQFDRILGLNNDLNQYSSSYFSEDSRNHVVIQSHKTERCDGNHFIEFWFGYSFGGLKFQFSETKEFRKKGKGIPIREGCWEYRDVVSGEKIDFYNPFGEFRGNSGCERGAS